MTNPSDSARDVEADITTEEVPVEDEVSTLGTDDEGSRSATPDSGSPRTTTKRPWLLKSFAICIALEIAMTWLVPFIHQSGVDRSKFRVSKSLFDLALLAVLRTFASSLAIALAYFLQYRGPASPFEGNDALNANGVRKTKEELEMEKLDEPVCRWVRRFFQQTTTPTELLAVATQVVGIAKCLDRLYFELRTNDSDVHQHPIFWIAILSTTVLSLVQTYLLPSVCDFFSELGNHQTTPNMIRNLSSQLFEPLLPTNGGHDEGDREASVVDPDNLAAEPDITADSAYKASWKDLMQMCMPDIHLIMIAAVFLVLAAIAQVYIPRFLGHILDNLSVIDHQDWDENASIYDIPHFVDNVKLLVTVSILAGIFSGLRGSIFVSIVLLLFRQSN